MSFTPERYSIQYMIGAARVKYGVLDEIFEDEIIQQKHITMYIDAHSVLYRVFREKSLPGLNAMEDLTLIKDTVIGFLNLIGHYRRYFATRMHKDNTIVLSFNYTPPEYQTSLYPDYDSHYEKYYDKKNLMYGRIFNMITKAFQFIQATSTYFEDVFCVTVQGLDDLTLFASQLKDKEYSILFTRNMLALQLLKKNKVVQFYNKRDDSYLITEEDCYKHGILKNNKRGIIPNERLDPSYLIYIWLFTGCKDVDMKHTKYIRQVPSMIKLLNDLFDEDSISESMSLKEFIRMVENKLNIKENDKISYKELQDRYYALSLPLSARALTKAQKVKLQAQMVNLFDEQQLEDLNQMIADMAKGEELLQIENLNLSKGLRWR